MHRCLAPLPWGARHLWGRVPSSSQHPGHLPLQAPATGRFHWGIQHNSLSYRSARGKGKVKGWTHLGQVQVCLLPVPPEGDGGARMWLDHWLPMDQQLYKDAQDNHSIDQPQEQRWHHPIEPAPRTCRAAPQSACRKALEQPGRQGACWPLALPVGS